MSLPSVKLSRGIHVIHLFYRVDRSRWSQLPPTASAAALTSLKDLCTANSAACQPRISTFVNVGGKADLAFIIYASELGQASQMQRDLEKCFPPGVLQPVYNYLSVTELPEYVTTEEDMKEGIARREKLTPGTPEFEAKLKEARERQAQYEHFRLNPELPDWEVMAFYPMNKRRAGNDNWYSLDLAVRKKLMLGHAAVGRKFAGRVTQLITGSTGIDDWEWGVTLMAHQTDSLKEIVYEMRFDEVSARYGEFGPFYINLRLTPDQIWSHLGL